MYNRGPPCEGSCAKCKDNQMRRSNKKLLEPVKPGDLDYVMTPRVVQRIGTFYQICEAVKRMNDLTDSMFFHYTAASMIRTMESCDIKFAIVPAGAVKSPVYIDEPWIRLVVDHTELAELTLLQCEVLDKKYFGLAPISLKRSRIHGKEPSTAQTDLLTKLLSHELLTDVEKQRFQLVLEEDSITKERATRVIRYLIGDNPKYGRWRNEGILKKRERDLKNKEQN